MLQLDELKLELEGLEPELKSLGQALNLTALKEEAAELEKVSAEPVSYTHLTLPTNSRV